MKSSRFGGWLAAGAVSGGLAFDFDVPTQPAMSGDAHEGQALVRRDPLLVMAQRLAWCEAARFGTFLHWGLYSQDGAAVTASPDKIYVSRKRKTPGTHCHAPIPC